jgi:hypothetical protein
MTIRFCKQTQKILPNDEKKMSKNNEIMLNYNS